MINIKNTIKWKIFEFQCLNVRRKGFWVHSARKKCFCSGVILMSLEYFSRTFLLLRLNWQMLAGDKHLEVTAVESMSKYH